MAVHPDVMELVQILDGAGFEFLAGEIMVEIANGLEIDDEGALNFDADLPLDYLGQRATRRAPIPADGQFSYAMKFLRLRMIEPMRRLAEAERIAGELHSANASDSKPVGISFVDADEIGGARSERREAPGQVEDIDHLQAVLDKLLAGSN